MREGGAADEGRTAARALVGDFIDKEGEIAQLGDFFRGQDRAAHLELEIGDGGDEIAVAGALAVAVDRALHLQRADLDAGERVGNGEAAVVVRVDAELRFLHRTEQRLRDRSDLPRHGAAVGVAHDEVIGASFIGGLVTGGGILGVHLVAVESVLAIEDDFAALRLQVGDGVADHGEVFLRRGAQDFRDVEHGSLADQRDDRRAGLEQKRDLLVALDLGIGAAGAAERGQFGVLEVEFLRLAEELDVLLVGAGPSPLDIVHAEGVEPLGDAEFIGEGEVDAFTLGAIAESGVVEGDGVGGGHVFRRINGFFTD